MSDHSAAKDPEQVLDALGEPVRRRILELLGQGPTPVGVLADQLPINRPGVSKHLRVLAEAGLVRRHSVGTRNLYALAPGGLAPLQVWLTSTWDVALTAYADRVAETVGTQQPQQIRPRPRKDAS